MPEITIRKGTPGVDLSKDEFSARFRLRFDDPAFAPLQASIDRLVLDSPRVQPARCLMAPPAVWFYE